MSDSQLYARLLLPRGHGYPLFHPQPYDDLWDIRQTGTEIGDVGVVKDGCFDVLFNICYPADHPINRRFNRGLPEGFEQLELPPSDIAPQVAYHPPGADVSNTRITKRRVDIDAGVENNVFLPAGAGAVVEISASAKETAVLLLPDGAARWELRPLRVFKDYALKHARSWYTWVNGRLGWMVESGDLYLITGVDKSSTWSVLATENRSEDLSLSLKLKAAQLASASGSCTWEWETTSSFANSGPRRHPGWERPHGSEAAKDQTLFLRGFKVAVRSSAWIKSPKALSITESKPTQILGKSGFVPYSPSKPGSASQSPVARSSRSGGPHEDMDSMEASVEYYPSSSMTYHPGCVVNDYLLESSPNADVAVTHDGDWMSVVHPEEKMPEDSVLLEWISARYHIREVSGAVFLDHPIKPIRLSSKEDSAPKKKALLISIRSMGSKLLDLPTDLYVDVHAMRQLLIERYGYSESDIAMLLDSGEGVQPNRINIMRAIGDLVRGARKGDSFFFLYCGPTTQVKSRPVVSEEEDGMDECLVPIDGEEYKIDDNEIRSDLVDALPVGANLVMLFDTFHTGEHVLDVPEYRDNRVYVPWISRARRNARRYSGFDPRPKSMTLRPIVVPKPFAEWHGSSPDRGAIVEHRTSVPQFARALLKDRASAKEITRPVSLYKLPESAEVVSLAACQDSQLTWEDGGKSMTHQLVRILQRDPQPSLRVVLASVRNGLQRVLNSNNSKSANLGMFDRPVPTYFDMDNFQDPELASHKPLDMGRKFTL